MFMKDSVYEMKDNVYERQCFMKDNVL